MKDILCVLALLVAFGASVMAFRSSEKNNKINKDLQKERYSRLEVEEMSQRHISRIKSLEVDLKEAQDKIEKIQSLVEQQKSINSDLQNQFEKLSRAKEDLEEKLNSTLHASAETTAETTANP